MMIYHIGKIMKGTNLFWDSIKCKIKYIKKANIKMSQNQLQIKIRKYFNIQGINKHLIVQTVFRKMKITEFNRKVLVKE